jgi:hypothetical protein
VVSLSESKYIVSLYIFIYITVYTTLYIYRIISEGSLEVKLLTIWTDEKQRWEESERREEERRSEKRKSQKKEDALCFSNDLWLRRFEK